MSTSFAPECTEAKKKYDTCFNSWYTDKFLTGKSMENECTDLWYEYKACIDSALVKKGMMKMLDDARTDAPFEKGGIPKDQIETNDEK